MARGPRDYIPIPHVPQQAEPEGPTPEEIVADGVVDLDSAARLCGHGVTWIREQMEAGTFTAFKLAKKWVIPRRQVIDFLAARMIAAAG